MNKQVNFAVISNDDQEMIVNFYPPLVYSVDNNGRDDQIKQALSDVLTIATGSPARMAEFDEKAIGLLEDKDVKQTYTHRTIFGSELTATFDKVGVRLQVKNGSMVFISAGATDAVIAVKPGH